MNIFKHEVQQFPCLYPVFLSLGILLGDFKYLQILYYTSLAASIAIIIYQQFSLLRGLQHKPNYIIKFLLCFILGVFAMQQRLKEVEAPILPYNNYFCYVEGQILSINTKEHGYKIILKNLKIHNLDPSITPKKIQLISKISINNSAPGDIIFVKAVLSPPAKPYLENSFDFSRDAYFKQIGATGYAVSPIKVISKANNNKFKEKINKFRSWLQNKINSKVGSKIGSIITALMINEYQNIEKQDLLNLRNTGLSHILSVSGMHLSLVVAIFFYSSRILLNIFLGATNLINVKKFAAVISMIGSFVYLLISGMEVAAVRSFIMSSLIIYAVLIDRTSDPLRSIAAAAFVILAIYPENLKLPSFQMSFAAVLGLITSFNFLNNFFNISAKNNIAQNIFYYLIGITFSSLIAGLATLPFVLYHFGQSANYSIIANLFAVPLTSFILMPGVIIIFFLLPFNFESVMLAIMKPAVKALLDIASFFNQLPHATTSFYKLSDANFCLISFSIIWLCIWQTKIRYFGITTLIFAIILQAQEKKPDLFIDWQGKNLAIINNSELIFLTKPVSRSKRQILTSYLGLNSIVSYESKKIEKLTCDDTVCILLKDQYQVKFDKTDFTVKIFYRNKLRGQYHNIAGTSLIKIS